MAPGVVFDRFNSISLNNEGQIIFFGMVTAPGTGTQRILWAAKIDSEPVALVRQGDATPGIAGGVFDLVSLIASPRSQNDSNHVVFTASVESPTRSGVSIWTIAGPGAEPELVVFQGDHAPGTGSGETTFQNLNHPRLDQSGRVIFQGVLEGPRVTTSNQSGYWVADSKGIHLIVRQGDQAPGTPPGVVFQRINLPIVTGTGQLAFYAILEGPGVDSSNELGLWATDADGVLRLICRTGDLFETSDDPGVDDLRIIRRIVLRDFNESGTIVYSLDFVGESTKNGCFASSFQQPLDESQSEQSSDDSSQDTVVATAEPDPEPETVAKGGGIGGWLVALLILVGAGLLLWLVIAAKKRRRS